ncbi:MAG TPA: glycosyltransferase [Usitatibacter sp.]|nr:glycosyltransferase [Usitatibacter sp.]
MKVILATIGSRGDVQPMVAVAQALASRGHEPLIAAPPDFASWVRAFGIDFVPLGIDVNAFMREHREALGANIWKFFHETRRLFDRELPAQLDKLLELGRDAGAIVFAAGAVAAPSAGEKLGIPVLGVLFTTTVVPSNDHAPVVIPWRTLPGWMNALLWRVMDVGWNALLGKGLNDARRRHGLRPIPDVTKHLYEESHFVAAVDRELFPLDPEWDDRIPHVGFLYARPNQAALDPDLAAWLDAGEPPVYVGFGSMMGKGPDRMRGVIVAALGRVGRRGLVSRGWAGLGDALPPHWRAIGDTPHELLFPRVACVVHHGGSGTTAAALRAGVPQVLAPLILDQYHHAQVLYEQGLAPRPVPMEKITAEELASAIRDALRIPASKRQVVADRLRASRGADAIVDRLEVMAVAGHERI